MKIALIPAVMTIAATMAIADAAEPIRMVDIPAGYFYMGSRALGEDFDEGPVHKVTISTPFRMSATEITNAQYEEFFPEHRALRGGTYTLYNTGDRFPDSCHKAQRVARESRDGGVTWEDRWDGAPLPDFKEGGRGSTIAGIHAGVVQLSDGSLMALGRGNSIPGPDGKPRMPMSISHDMGRTWTYHASELPPIDGGQRLVLRRLNEGPLLLVSFTDHPQRTPEADRGGVHDA